TVIGGNDVFPFVQLLFGLAFVPAVKLLLEQPVSAPAKPVEKRSPRQHAQPTDDEQTNRQRALTLWGETDKLPGSLAYRYITEHRGLSIDVIDNIDECLRFHPRCPIRNHTTGEVIFAPAMIGLFRSIAANEPVAIHRTALTSEGRKLTTIPRPKQFLAPIGGAALKLSSDENVTYGVTVGEGIETTIAA